MMTDPTSPLAALLTTFFETKTGCDVDGTMAYFAPDMATYIDATLGWDLDSYEALQSTFREYMPNWAPPARSYATQILSNETSALIRMVDTPELFGGELRILAAVDFADGKIVRWVDYWDSSSFDDDLYLQFRTPAEHFPTDLKDGDVFRINVPDGDKPGLFYPEYEDLGDGKELTADVGYIGRLRHPFKTNRTLTICNGIFSHGVLGAVRCLTDPRVREENERYLADRFPDGKFAMLLRVDVVDNRIVPLVLQDRDACVRSKRSGIRWWCSAVSARRRPTIRPWPAATTSARPGRT